MDNIKAYIPTICEDDQSERRKRKTAQLVYGTLGAELLAIKSIHLYLGMAGEGRIFQGFSSG